MHNDNSQIIKRTKALINLTSVTEFKNKKILSKLGIQRNLNLIKTRKTTINLKLCDTPEEFLLKSRRILIPLLSSISFKVLESLTEL